MEKIIVKGKYGESQILVGERLENIGAYVSPDNTFPDNTFVITDTNLRGAYGHAWPKTPCLALEPGEQSKTLASAGRVFQWLLENKADRSSFILGIGGGVVCDLAGFVASTYMRGTGFGFVATSLLAQVDASVGGKNGVNLDGYKNMVGTFNQPRFVVCDTDMLKTLPAEELRNGMAEVVKHALIADKPMFEALEKDPERVLKLESHFLNYLVSRSVHIKSEIVGRDERETGERRKLNLGHTWGHAVEKVHGLPHGHAVGVGLAFAAKLSVGRGLLSQHELERLTSLLERLGLPVQTPGKPEAVFETMGKDKKRERGHIHFVLNRGIGEVVVEPLSLEEIRKYIQ
jgi:3-dehydroquinate synthase